MPVEISPEVYEERVRKVLELIECDPVRSVAALAEEVRLSPAHLQRLFKKNTGMDVGEALTEAKLQKAADLLATTNAGIKEIAFMVGYKHHSSFVRAFQRRFSSTPKSHRLGRSYPVAK